MDVYTIGSATHVLSCLKSKFLMHSRTHVKKGMCERTCMRGMF